ncbi:hypothetical protein NG54_02980 [Heyndrickxia ginsengihumi]|uniref:Uncharacterized protein n=1 Tax=Heyndrickxia ginsengihumi TaxID=363870 RepID=A0A0A6Y2G3_9BACI|nr:hypothetical protein NG54_02980 [Heyndrickxia ginsengihumi]
MFTTHFTSNSGGCIFEGIHFCIILGLFQWPRYTPVGSPQFRFSRRILAPSALIQLFMNSLNTQWISAPVNIG